MLNTSIQLAGYEKRFDFFFLSNLYIRPPTFYLLLPIISYPTIHSSPFLLLIYTIEPGISALFRRTRFHLFFSGVALLAHEEWCGGLEDVFGFFAGKKNVWGGDMFIL